MRSICKKITSQLVVFVMVVSMMLTNVTLVEAVTVSEMKTVFNNLKNSYPTGAVWKGNYNNIAWECHGFSLLVCNALFGENANNWGMVYDVNNLCVGDLVRYRSTTAYDHSIVVTNISGDTISYVDCNGTASNGTYVYNRIDWTKTITRSNLQVLLNKTLTDGRRGFIRHKSGNNITSLDTNDPSIIYPGLAGFTNGGAYWWSASGYGINGTMKYTYCNGNTRDSWARWSFNLAAIGGSGYYKVEAYIPNNHATTSNAHYHILHADKTDYKSVNQNNTSNAWVDLGTYDFTSIATAAVELDDATGETYVNTGSPKIGFDAIRLSYVSAISVVNKTALTTSITNATALIASKTIGIAVGNVSQAAHDAYNAAITNATVVKNNASVTQAQVDAAVTDLATATTIFNNAVIAVGDKTALVTAITNATSLLASKTIGIAVGNVSQAAHDAYNAAITNATVVENNTSATQVEVDAAVTALETETTAFNNAIIPVGDKTALTTSITNATTLLASIPIGTAVGNVSQGAHDVYNSAIASAIVVDNANATQTEVDAAVTDLAIATTTFNNAIIKVGTPKSIKATPTTITLNKAATKQITIAGTMKDGTKADVTSACTFSPADSAIATVDASGLITAQAGGTTTITATLGAKKASVKVTVNPSITSLKASAETVVLESKASQSVKLNVVYDTGKTENVTRKAVWSSQNTSIATVNSGKIIGVAKGSTRVIATYRGYSAEIQVTVTPVLAKLFASTKDNPALTTLNAQIGDTIGDVIITATYVGDDPADVTQSCTWSTSNIKYADVNKTTGKITAIGKGTSTITATLGKKKATIKVNVIP